MRDDPTENGVLIMMESQRQALEMRFEVEMRSIPDRYKEVVGHKPGRFTQGINRNGAVGFAKNLLRRTAGRRNASGLKELLKHEHPELSVEYLVMLSPWCSLFTEDELNEAALRLENAIQ